MCIHGKICVYVLMINNSNNQGWFFFPNSLPQILKRGETWLLYFKGKTIKSYMQVNVAVPLIRKAGVAYNANDIWAVLSALTGLCLVDEVCNFAQTGFTIGLNIEKVSKTCIIGRQLWKTQEQDIHSHLRLHYLMQQHVQKLRKIVCKVLLNSNRNC